MNKVVFAIALLLIVPALYAQQPEPANHTAQSSTPAEPQAAPQTPAQNSSTQTNLPAATRPGHPLDPSDVDILTGKRDREIEASQAAGVPVSMGVYDNYGNFSANGGRFGSAFDIGLLPLAQIGNPVYFSRLQPRGFGRGGFRGSHSR
jgi:hypothetical protein